MHKLSFSRIWRSIVLRLRYFVYKVRFVMGIRRPSDLAINIYPWPELAALPGNTLLIKDLIYRKWPDDLVSLAEQVIEHQVKIFKDDNINISGASTREDNVVVQPSKSINSIFIDTYQPIEWHSDFYSGYRWSGDSFYRNVKVAPCLGTDIKVPRELSRFQHIGALLYGNPPKAAEEFMFQVCDWISANPFERGVNWESSMDVALRAINWIWGLRFFEDQLKDFPDFQRQIANSLRDHGRHVYENLDFYGEDIQTNNHYLSEIVGLIYIGGCLPQLPESDLWLAFGIQELVSEMDREVFKDGVCKEGSTSYHRLVTELFVSGSALIERLPYKRRLRLLNLDISSHKQKPSLKPLDKGAFTLFNSGQVLSHAFYTKLEAMAGFSLAIRKPSGFVSQAGDNDSGRVHKLLPTPKEEILNHDHLFATIGHLLGKEYLINAGIKADLEGKLLCGDLWIHNNQLSLPKLFSEKVKLFPEGGVASTKKGDAYLAVFCGPTFGHAHNDKNSFELSINCLDFIVDGGCPVYTANPEIRNRFRSTEMHSTIYVKHLEQNVWPEGIKGLFSLPEKSTPELSVDEYGTIISSHNGYGTVHKRFFHLENQKLEIYDEFQDDRERYLVFNLHPAVSVNTVVGDANLVHSFQLQHNTGFSLLLTVEGGQSFEVSPGSFSSGYMKQIKNQRLQIRLYSHLVRSTFSW